jgi:hypothetical protein
VPLGSPAQTKDALSERFLQSKRKTFASDSQITSLHAQKISKIKVKRSQKRFHLIQSVLFTPEVTVGHAAKSLTNRCNISKFDSISSQPIKSQSMFATPKILHFCRAAKNLATKD